MEYGQLFGFQMRGSVYAPVAYKRAINPGGNRAAYTVPNLIVVILTNFQDTRGTNKVTGQVIAWHYRPLDALYPIVYLDYIVLKVRQESYVINKSVFLEQDINIEGQQKLPGMWLAENEGVKFWLNVLTELKKRGLNDIFIACVDGLKGIPDAINTVYPEACVQLCIVHMECNSLRFVSWKDDKAVTRDLKGFIRCPRKRQVSRHWKRPLRLRTVAILR